MQFLWDVKLSDFNFKNVLKFCEGYCNNEITERSTCYTIQLMHYSHFKTHSLQHLKPIKW